MNKENKSTVLSAIDKLYGKSSTNLWHGIKKGLNVLATNPVRGNIQSLLVLTDGAYPSVFTFVLLAEINYSLQGLPTICVLFKDMFPNYARLYWTTVT